jgi:cyanate lyase
VADGSKQLTYDGYNKSDGSSPTVVTESIYMTGVIDAREKQAVAVLDVGDAFLHADNDKRILMLLRGKLAEMMVRVDPSMYRKYIIYSHKGVPMLDLRLSKALYGMLRAALLFYNKLRSDFEYMVFEINPYDECVANKMVEGVHMTI